MIGINIRQGHGRYRSTYIVTLTSHYQIYNISSYTLQVAQKSLTSTVVSFLRMRIIVHNNHCKNKHDIVIYDRVVYMD